MNTDILSMWYTWYDVKVKSVTVPSVSLNDSSRYRKIATIHSSRGSHLKFMRKGFYNFSYSEVTYYITKATEFRPDIVSVEMYGDPRYAWAILCANGMKSFFEFTCDQYIMVPTLSDVTRELGV